jgi:hypothetical protein
MSTIDFSNLPPAERAKRFRDLAGDARREAAQTTGALRESYLIAARNWDELAVEAEGLASKSKAN